MNWFLRQFDIAEVTVVKALDGPASQIGDNMALFRQQEHLLALCNLIRIAKLAANCG